MILSLDLRWRYGRAGEEIEPQLFSLLEEMELAGSLRLAAARVRVSYRYAWGLLRKWEGVFGGPLVELQRGRGARLTALGVKLLWAWRQGRGRLAPQLEGLASELGLALGRTLAKGEAPSLRVFASHGLALGLLRDAVNAGGRVQLELQFRGSLESLRLYRAGKCDVAGFHLPEGPLGARLAPRYRRHLEPQADALVQVVRREQGFITARGNPKRITSVRDLTRRGLRFINRQPASGTRLIFDLLLEEAGVEPARVAGYGTEEFTHMAVAAMVASGAADVGFGIRAAAAQLGLGFVPVTRENYLFAVPVAALDSLPLRELLQVLRSPQFREQVAALAGYDAEGAGSTHTVRGLLGGRA